MQENKLPKEDFEFIESLILDREKTGQIKYTVDRAIEADVKYSFLKDVYGKEHVDSVLASLGKDFMDLNDPEVFEAVKTKKD